MAPGSETDDANDAVSTYPFTEETIAATKRQRLNSSYGTLTSPSPSSSDTMPLPTLPFEIMLEILARLPVKFLMQFQSVCKSWKSLISDPKFAKKHLRVSKTRHHLLATYPNFYPRFLTDYPLSSVFTEVTAPATRLEYPPYNRNCSDQIVDSCHGIICLAVDQRFPLLWNPSIRKFTKLPSLANPKLEGCCTVYGFGYDHLNDSYKVVTGSCYESGGRYKTEVNVLTLGTNAWRRIQDFPLGVPCSDTGKFASGTVNWLASRNSNSSWVIVSLDLEKESYQELLLHDYGGEVTLFTLFLELGVLRDCLCILSHNDTFSEIWLMKEYGNSDSWTKLFRVPYMDIEFCPYINPLYVSEDDKVLLKYRSSLVVYNARDGTFKTPEIQNIYGWMVPEIYQESLISPCSL